VKQLHALILICASFALLAYIRSLLSLMLLGTWGYRFIEFWWFYISVFIGVSFLSIKFQKLKLYSLILALPILSIIATRTLFYIWVAFYFPISINLTINFIICFYFATILLIYLYSLGIYQDYFKPVILVLVISLLPLAHQFAYGVKHEAEFSKTSNQKHQRTP
jgi:hypothetical protein